jgi:hypothetical protein
LISVYAYLQESYENTGIPSISTKDFDSKYEKTVDDLYREILLRPADREGLMHFSSLLEDGKITEDGLRELLLNSEEKKEMEDGK